MTTEFCQSCSVLYSWSHSQWCWEGQLQEHLAGDGSLLPVNSCFNASDSLEMQKAVLKQQSRSTPRTAIRNVATHRSLFQPLASALC